MKKYTLGFLLSLFYFSILISQTEISGIINVYAKVNNIEECTSELVVDDATGFAENMSVILIQMQGAIIDLDNSENFGNITDLGSAGLFERAIIQTINNNTIILQNTILNQYDVAGNVQLVSIPIFDDATVVAPLTAQAWNGNTGGILALEVRNTLQLNATIDLQGLGFRGGTAGINDENNCNFAISHNNYSYPLENYRGAEKGEGIATFTTGAEAGRGAQANGGGGGNDHNAGGGGGGHMTAGGQGGNNEEPSFFGCDGFFPGRGGKAIPPNQDRLFLGGGGGAGHDNNGVATDGGAGGGIAIIIANTFIGSISALRASGVTAETAPGDGGGGGGAGGTIYLDVQTLDPSLPIDLSGGSGAQTNGSGGDRCFGPGGGGSGGRLITIPNITVTLSNEGGLAGTVVNSTAGCNGSNNEAEPGQRGTGEEIFPIPESTQSGGAPAIINQPNNLSICVDADTTLKVTVQGSGLNFQWQANNGNGFENLSDGPVFSGTQSSNLSINGVTTQMSNTPFRLIIMSTCFDDIVSAPIQLEVIQFPTASFDFTINGLSVQFNNLSSNASSQEWKFGDGENSTEINPTHAYSTPGTYQVTLSVSNECGQVVLSQTVQLNGAPTALFSADNISGCVPLSVNFINESTNGPTSFVWLLPGGTPNFSTEINPSVQYNLAGTYGVTLIASNSIGIDTFVQEALISVNAVPVATFSVDVNDLTVNFNNESQNGASYEWQFGDSNSSADENPSHIYTTAGNYPVTLIATNECGSNMNTQVITVGAFPSADFTAIGLGGCSPHAVRFQDASTGSIDTWSWTFPGGEPTISNEPNPIVIYPSAGAYDVSLTVSGALGSSTISNSKIVEILPFPSAAFSYELEGNTVRFFNESTDAFSYKWSFGDGNISDEANPTHTYATGGFYEVTLNAQNIYCGNAASQTIFIVVTDTNNPIPDGIRIFPNPFNEFLLLEIPDSAKQSFEVSMFNLTGQLIYQHIISNRHHIATAELPAGTYLVQIRNEESIWTGKYVKH